MPIITRKWAIVSVVLLLNHQNCCEKFKIALLSWPTVSPYKYPVKANSPRSPGKQNTLCSPQIFQVKCGKGEDKHCFLWLSLFPQKIPLAQAFTAEVSIRMPVAGGWEGIRALN